MSQEELTYLQLKRSYIGVVERGTRNTSLQNIDKIIHALNGSLSAYTGILFPFILIPTRLLAS
ncbi:MAG: helix-turn-helix transcriptional regulator [Cytobacillus gottheilii]|uniref:helix-turn-helix domain-containing protein n=1 Tax=Cytobacillus gottheilii TaxID=859144 RepID=UPI003464DC8C